MSTGTDGGKPKDYKKLSQIKSVIFLILAVLILAGMALEKKTVSTENETEAVQESSSSYQIPQELISEAQAQPRAAIGSAETAKETGTVKVSENESYSDKEHVALYLYLYGKLPPNYITKTQAKKKGWDPDTGNLWDVLPGMSIGGGEFRNEEKKLPEKEGRTWKECDIGYEGGDRGEKRIVYSDDGLIYYTGDHYNSFECLYGDGGLNEKDNS